MTPAKINELVARKLGWKIGRFKKDGKEHYAIKDPESQSLMLDSWSQLPPYSTDIGAAWEIVNWCEANDIAVIVDNATGWRCNLCDDGDNAAEADTAPMAICLAFLKLEDK